MATQKERQDRRMDFYILMSHGARLSEAVKTVSVKYAVTGRTLYRDWALRDTWGLEFNERLQKDRLVQDTLFNLAEYKRRLWAIVDAKDPLVNAKGDSKWPYELPDINERSKALVELINTEFRKLTAAQSVGMVEQTPVIINIREQAEKMHDRIVELCGDDLKLQDLVVQLIYDLATSEN